MPPRKRMRWKQPAPSGSGQSPANLCFREANKLHSELRAMLDQPDDAIRFEKPYLPESDFPIWEFVRKFNRAPKEVREDGESNKK